jgi:hypothetical protein
MNVWVCYGQLRQWFDAQLSDHGSDAMAGHDHSKMHQ